MTTENPYHPPRVNDAVERPKPHAMGPILGGLVAIVLATLLMGVLGLLAALLGVGSWWAYKFWPRPPAVDDPGARAFLQQMETSPEVADAIAEASQPQPADPPDDVLGGIRL
jgi:hypothetical protein